MIPKHRSRTTRFRYDQVRLLNAAGLGDTMIARELGISRERVRQIRDELGLPRNLKSVCGTNPDKEEILADIKMLSNEGKTRKEIRTALKGRRSEGTIKTYIRELGIKNDLISSTEFLDVCNRFNNDPVAVSRYLSKSRSYVVHKMSDLKISMKSSERKKNRRINKNEKAQMRDLRITGESCEGIAIKLNLSPATVYKFCRKNNIAKGASHGL